MRVEFENIIRKCIPYQQSDFEFFVAGQIDENIKTNFFWMIWIKLNVLLSKDVISKENICSVNYESNLILMLYNDIFDIQKFIFKIKIQRKFL